MTDTELQDERAYVDFEVTLTELIGRKLYGPNYRENTDQLNDAEGAGIMLRVLSVPTPDEYRGRV